jgi:phenylacetate-CoA ligase
VSDQSASALPLYRNALDWAAFAREYPAPDVFERSVYRWSREQIRDLQNRRFLEVVQHGWKNAFYRRRWSASGLAPSDIRSLDDIGRLPMYDSDDVKDSQARNPPFGDFHDLARKDLAHGPFKLQTSGGTTGTPRTTLFEPLAWEVQALCGARAMYIQGARPGDVMQIPMTCSLANGGWLAYKACHDYLGILPITTGSGVVTASRRQLELAFQYGTNIWGSFPEYLLRLADVAHEELSTSVQRLKTKFLRTYLGPDLEGTLRRELEEKWGCPAYDTYGAHEIGNAAFECRAKNGLHLMEDCMFVEVVDAETGKPVAPGERGNLVCTVFFRSRPPVIRYNLRDLGRLLPEGDCECGSRFRRMDHFLGRSDAMVKVRGVNVYPMACLAAVRSDERTTGEWVCVMHSRVNGSVPRDEMEVRIEARDGAGDLPGLQAKLKRRLKEDLGVKVEVTLVPQGSLDKDANTGGNEGKARRLLDLRPAYRGSAR